MIVRALALAAALLSSGCLVDGMCCRMPVTEADVTITWTVDGASAASGCAAAGGATVRIELDAVDLAPHLREVPCSDGAATLRALVWLPETFTEGAAVAVVRLLDAAGAELTARRVVVGWSDAADRPEPRLALVWRQAGVLTAAAPLVRPSPAGALTVRWCLPLAAGQPLHVQVDGPMWLERDAEPPATELTFPALAPGTYQVTFAPALVFPPTVPVVVTAGQEARLESQACQVSAP